VLPAAGFFLPKGVNQMRDDIETLLSTPEGVKQAVDQLEARLITEAQAVLRAAGKKTVPLRMTLNHALAILAPSGHEEACLVMAIQLGWEPHANKSAAENLFRASHAVALIWAAYDAHPRYIKITEENCGKVEECATLIDPATPRHKPTHAKILAWFRETHAAEAQAIGERIKVDMRKRGWRI
jgi:hypothetical protein